MMCDKWCIEFAKRATRFNWKPSPFILEIGSRDTNGTVRPVLEPHADKYVGVDLVAGRGVDQVLDVAVLSEHYHGESVDVVVCTEVVEHIDDWRLALYQMLKVLRHNGLLILTTRSPNFPNHNYPSDYWRYTQDDLKKIFTPVGEVLAIEDDPSPPYCAGVGIILRKTVSNAEVANWYWADLPRIHLQAAPPPIQ